MTYHPSALMSGTPSVSAAKTISTNYQPSTTRPTLVLICGNISLTTAQTAIVQLCSDANTTPTTVVNQAECSDAPTAGSSSHPFFFAHVVQPSHYYRVNRSSGSGTVTIPYVVEVPL